MPRRRRHLPLGRYRERVNDRNRQRLNRENNVNETIPIFDIGIVRNMRPREYLNIARTAAMATPYFDIGNLIEECVYCHSKQFTCELNKSSLCCHKGSVAINIPQSHPNLEHLIVSGNQNARHYLENIRKYNSALSFASFGAEVSLPPGKGPYCFRIHGAVYHRIGAMEAAPGNVPAFGQLYIMDTAEANNIRLNQPVNRELKRDILELLNEVLDDCNNPYIQSFKQLREVEEELKNHGHDISNLRMVFHDVPGADLRRFNPARVSEVAAVFVADNDGAPPSNRSIQLYRRGEGIENKTNCIQSLPITSQHIDPCVYPLLFPRGEHGWCPSISVGNQTTTRQNITMLEYAQHRFAIREDFSLIHSSGKLTQQFAVDLYCRVEAARLDYIRHHQKELRADSYLGLMDSLHSRAEAEGLRTGRVVILPSSFVGSPRSMMQHYQDAMAMVRTFGKPDLFLTMTCNINWREIQENLMPWEKAEHRPDLISRVFNAKRENLIDLIVKKKIFGDVKTFIWTQEYQKRGLPHIHLLVSLTEQYKIRETEDIDSIVSAELPHPDVHPRLYEVVSKFHIHGPCGVDNPASPCMNLENNQCSKHFPKDFMEETVNNGNGYPIYRRRNNGHTATVRVQSKNIIVDNRYVVPYNVFLALHFQCHLNVEVCASIVSVKYIHKYILKGYDGANLKITTEDNELHHDEINTFLNARYIGPSEAMARIFSFPLHGISHSILRLAVHLPNSQTVYYNENQDVEAVLNERGRQTTLTEFFVENAKPNSTSRNILYKDFPEKFVWNKSTKKWTKRQRGSDKVIGRMYHVSPKEGEKYFLRLLLLHVPGATSFDNLKTLNDQVFPTFKGACIARGLFTSDRQWENTMAEACTFQMPNQLRELFSYICVFENDTANPATLWETFKNYLCEDFLRDHDERSSNDLALKAISESIGCHGITLTDVGLPLPRLHLIEEAGRLFDIHAEHERASNLYSKATEEQKCFIDDVLRAIYNPEANQQKAFFLNAPGGCGKTFCYSTIMHYVRGKCDSCIPVAWTGIAAMLLEGGRTVHNRFKLPIQLNETSVSSIKANSNEANFIKNCKVILWDEAPMSNKYALSCVDRLLRDVADREDREKLFGGKVIVLGGDFRQCAPIVPGASRSAIVENSIIRSPLWSMFKKMSLTKNMRANEDELLFSEYLLKIGNGQEIYHNEIGPSLITLPPQCIVNDNIIEEIFNEGFSEDALKRTKNHAILSPKNEHCDEINDKIINQLNNDGMVYFSVDRITQEEGEQLHVPDEFLHSLTPSGLPPHKLCLKKGAIVILLRNLNPKKGLVNGTRLMVKEMHENVLLLEVITGSVVGNKVLIPKLSLEPSENNFPIKFKRRQFPCRIAFAITITKSQGQTLDKVGIYLPEPCFQHGALYVAMSRCRAFNCLKIQVKEQKNQGHLAKDQRVFTKNIVWDEFLLD